MRLKDFHSRLKEFQLAGVVHKNKNAWVVHHDSHSDFQFIIKASSRGRVMGVMPIDLHPLVEEDYRNAIGAYRRRRVKVPQKILSPNQFFDLLGKITRGEV